VGGEKNQSKTKNPETQEVATRGKSEESKTGKEDRGARIPEKIPGDDGVNPFKKQKKIRRTT